MIKADEMFKLTLVRFNLGLGQNLRRMLWQWENCVNTALGEELSLKTSVMNGSYAHLGNSLLDTVHPSFNNSTLL